MSAMVEMAAPAGAVELEQVVADAWATHRAASDAGLPEPVIVLLRDAIWHLEDHVEYGDGDGDRRRRAVALAVKVVRRWLA